MNFFSKQISWINNNYSSINIKISDPYLYNFWDTTFDMDHGLWLGEDKSFCRLARDYGFKIYANIKSKITHHGTYGWSGKFEDALTQEKK